MALWQFDFWIIPMNRKKENFQEDEILSWKKEKINIDINKFFENILKEEASWSEHIKQYGEGDKTCIKLRVEDNKIDEISCRLDLRSLSKDQLEKILDYISKIKGEIFYKGEIYPASFESIKNLIKESEAAKFCVNPQQYFEEIVNK